MLWGRWPVLMGVVFASLLALYRFAPDRTARTSRTLVPGAALAASCWLVLSLGFSWYVANFSHYGATFGTLSAAVALMLWIYYSAFAMAVGAALNREIEARSPVAPPP